MSNDESDHLDKFEKVANDAEENLVLQTEVIELLEQRNYKLNGKDKKNGNGGVISRVLAKI